MAHYQPQSRVPVFAADVCSLCFRNDPSNERLLRIYCNNYAEHTGVPPILVTWSEWRWALVPIRPLPEPHLLHGNYVRCNGPAQCRGERCTFAHSNEELAVWNTLLDEKRQQGFAGPRMHVNSHSASRQDEIGFEGGPQSWPVFTESRVKSSYHERSKNPPSVDNAKLDLTQINYQSKFCSLLYLEEKQHIDLLNQKCNHDYRITMYKRGNVPSWVRVLKESDRFSRYGCISGMSGDQIMYASQASECLFIVDQSGEQKIKVCDAKILPENMHGHYDEMLIKFTGEEAGKLERHYNLGTGLCNLVFSIEFEVKHFYFDLLHDSLKSLSPHQIDKVVPPVSAINNYPSRSRSFPHLRRPAWYDFLKLDEQSQQPALEKVVSSNYQIPVLVSGAFGTGKTRLLAVATYQFIEEGKRTWTPTRVLLCCHHQVTADTFLNEYFGEMVYHETNPWEVMLIRLTRARYNAEKSEYYNLCLTNKAFKEMFPWKYAQENYVVVVTTFATALNINDVVGDKYFTHILLDEAAQVREPEAVAPLCMASEKTKLVIAGDDQQVGPSILVLGNIPQHYGLGKSLFTRLLEFYNKHNLPVAVLNTNYRCHKAIVSLARSLFYSHHLKSCAEPCSIRGVSHPIWFVCSSLDKEPQTRLDADPNEAKVLVDQLKAFFKDLSLLDDVCILANNRNQLHEIKDRLFRQKRVFIPAQFLPTYLIQGNEFKALFMSTTESLDPSGYSNNPTKSLCSPSVFNTAITRAKSLVVAVGNPYTLMAVEEKLDKSKQCWAKYLNQCFSANTILKSPGITDGAVQELQQFVKQKLNELPPMPSATPSLSVQEEGIESSSTHVQKRSPAPVKASSLAQIQANSPVVERPPVQSQQAVSKVASSPVKEKTDTFMEVSFTPTGRDIYVEQSQLADKDRFEYEQQLSKLKEEILEMQKEMSVVKEQHLQHLQDLQKEYSTSQMKKKLDSVLYRQMNNYELEHQRSAMKRPMKDVGLQFNFLIPMSDHLRGVHVVGEKLFQISGEFSQLLEWEEYGLRIQVPKGATSTPCDIAIKAIVAGQFEFPEGTDLVSAVYAISVSKKLTQHIILEMQHCVAISSEEQGRFLSFVRAKYNQPDLPYLFKLLKNGVFPPHSDYGKITCDHFCLVGTVMGRNSLSHENIGHSSQVQQNIAEPVKPLSKGDSDGLVVEEAKGSAKSSDDCKAPGNVASKDATTGSTLQSNGTVDKTNDIVCPLLDYTAYVFYINTERNRWKMHFNVTKKLDALIQQVKKEHDTCDEATHFQFQFCTDEILLDLPKQYTNKGWSILPNVYPCKLLKQVVDNWNNATPSCCHIDVLAVDGPDTAPFLRYYAPVCGITSKDTSLLIFQRLQIKATSVQSDMAHSSPPVTQGALDEPPDILDLLNKVACKARDKWEMMGLALRIELDQLNSFAKHADPIKCYMEVFSTWKKNTNPPFTWATVINSLKLPIVGETELAIEIEEWLSGLNN